MANFCKEGVAFEEEDLGGKVTGSKLGACNDSWLWNLSEIYWLTVHLLYICERCDMSSINKRFTRVVATLKKLTRPRV